MEYKENFIEYWTTEYLDILDEFKEATSDLTFKKEEIALGEIVQEKPDYIPQRAWDTLFITDTKKIERHIRKQSSYYYTTSFGEDVLCITANATKFAFIAKDLNRYGGRSRGHLEVFDYWETKVKGNDWINNSDVFTMFEVAKELYGDENVSLFPSCLSDPSLYGLKDRGGTILIRHEAFWCKDQYGVSILIENGFTAINFKDDGSLSSAHPFKFACSKRDPLYIELGIHHPHVRRTNEIKEMSFRPVCTGDDSPLNMALSVWQAERNEDSAFNLLLNYQNLLSKEDEEGVPYQRMRQIMKYDSDTEIPTISNRQVINGIIDQIVKINVNKSDSDFKINIDKSSINNLVDSENSSDSFLHISDNRIYTKEFINFRQYNEKVYTTFIFNGDEIEIGIDSHDPLRFDLTGVNEDHPEWSGANKKLPTDSDIQFIERRLNTIVNHKLIDLYDVNKISHEFEEELIGLNEVGRTANIDNFI